MQSSRTLLFGGTFDPPHLAHTTLPPLAAQRLGCTRILYIPAAANPLKAGDRATAAEHRLAMLRLAIETVPGAEVSTVELDRPGPSYTVETLEALRERRGGDELFLLIGSDQALAFHEWKDWRRILEFATPAVMVRPPLTAASFREQLAETYEPEEAKRWLAWTVPVPRIDICATRLRRQLAAGEDVDGLIQPAVLAYIREHGLYRGGFSTRDPG